MHFFAFCVLVMCRRKTRMLSIVSDLYLAARQQLGIVSCKFMNFREASSL